MTLASMLRERVEQARLRFEESRVDLQKWEEALALELKQPGNGYEVSYESSPVGPNNLQLLANLSREETLGKNAFVRSRILNYGGPIIVPMLIESLRPSISRSTVYNVINEMKENGEIFQREDGRIEAIKM